MKKLLAFIFTAILLNASAQFNFQPVYDQVPDLPKGILETVSYNNTHMRHLTADEPESCQGLPRAYSLMGLILDGKNYFNENLNRVADLSGITATDIMNDPQMAALAYAKAFKLLMDQKIIASVERTTEVSLSILADVFAELTEIPDSGLVNGFARDCQLYSYLNFMNDAAMADQFNFPVYHFNLADFFGNDRFKVLSASKIAFTDEGIKGDGFIYPSPMQSRSAQYGPAIWNPASSCNYSSRAGTAVSAITIHTIQGTYAGAISWAQNCASSVSYHYVIRSSDGQITQMVDETLKAWHVGSENPYTIGYEHEGYVTDASWYTTAMYNASADLSRDICSSGYGINPLRTYFGPSSTGTDVIGSCTKIKGHQHYPYQTHTDPGINWNWERYYKLINNAPVVTTVTTSTGTFYDSGGSSAAYTNDERKLTLFAPIGATSVTLTFTAFDLEYDWDFMLIYDGNSTSSPLIGKYTGTTSPGTVTSTGGSLLVEFRSDCSTVNPGWIANYTSSTTGGSTADVIAPTTSITVPSTWVSNDFTSSFTDADNTGGSGVEKSFYQVIDFDGTDWRANANRGFFSDNFDLATIHPDWTSVTGTWNITSSALTQNDQTLSNTNIYAFLNHSLSNRYLYNWSGKIEGTGTNRRAGFHYFCDNPTLTNRGNSYFVWFRVDTDVIEIYKVTSDVFTLMSSTPYTFNPAQWYDFKVMYDRITGKTMVYVDNVLSATWTDPSPYSSGNYISFRSGNANWAVNNLKVYRSRAASSLVLVGPTGDLRYQNQDPSTPAGRIKTMINDNAGNLSSLAYLDINVDTTAPSASPMINDGTPVDTDTWTSTNTVNAYWDSSNDPHSGVIRYWYALGTSPGATDVVNWTDNSWYDSVAVTGLSMLVGQTYYLSVKAENSVGLIGPVTTSDGFTIVAPSLPPVANFYSGSTIVCQDQCITFNNTSTDATSFNWQFTGGDITSSTLANPTVCYSATGVFTATLVATGPGGVDTLTQSVDVTVYNHPSAAFTMSTDTVILPSGFVGFTNTSVDANGYNWDFGDGNSSTNTDPWNNYTSAGVYTVTLIALNGPCENDTITSTVVVLNPSSVNEIGNDLVRIYPNPFSNWIFIEGNNLAGLSMTLQNAIGETVIARTLTGKDAIALNELPKGMYCVRIVNANGTTLERKLVKH